MELNGKKHDLSQRSLITTTATADGADAFVPGAVGAGIGKVPASWDFEADVVVIGAGAAGLPAAVKAADEGASVIVVEANYDVGGHAIISGGHMALGGGTHKLPIKADIRRAIGKEAGDTAKVQLVERLDG